MRKKVEQKNISFNTTYDVKDDFDSDKFIKLRMRVCHDGKNPAGSNFSKDSLINAQSSISNIPILAYVVSDDDKKLDFGSHNMGYEKSVLSEDGSEYKLIYQEIPIGVIPEDNNYTVEEYDGKTYAFVDGYVWKDYSNYAQDIIERDETKKLSMEIIIDTLNYDDSDKEYIVTGFRYKGITLLGDDIRTGMANAQATIFSDDNKEKILNMMSELKFALEQNKKGVKEMDNEKIVTGVQMDEKKDVETFDAGTEDAQVTDAPADAAEGTPETYAEEPSDGADTANADAPVADKYELSFEDIRCKLREKLNYGWITRVYADKFDYETCDIERENALFRQAYRIENDEIIFEGEPQKMYVEVLTEDEKNALEATRAGLETELNSLKAEMEALKATNAELTAFKLEVEKQQTDAEKSAVLSKWSALLSANADFVALMASDLSEFTADDIDVKCKVIYADANAKFSVAETKTDSVVRFSVGETHDDKKTNQPYGGLFAEFGN